DPGPARFVLVAELRAGEELPAVGAGLARAGAVAGRGAFRGAVAAETVTHTHALPQSSDSPGSGSEATPASRRAGRSLMVQWPQKYSTPPLGVTLTLFARADG